MEIVSGAGTRPSMTGRFPTKTFWSKPVKPVDPNEPNAPPEDEPEPVDDE